MSASLEVRGAPRDTILAVRGLAAHPPIVRATLLDVAEALGTPVDSLAVVIARESDWNPATRRPAGAYGLLRHTVGGGLPEFAAPGAVARVAELSAVDQLRRVVLPYFSRHPSARGASVAHLGMLNFWPTRASSPPDFVLWREADGAVYTYNAPRFDAARKGFVTVGDVHAYFAEVEREANGQRVDVDGRVFGEPPR